MDLRVSDDWDAAQRVAEEARRTWERDRTRRLCASTVPIPDEIDSKGVVVRHGLMTVLEILGLDRR
jgi:hypothetical protein